MLGQVRHGNARLLRALVTVGRVVDRRLQACLNEFGLTLDAWRALELIVQRPGMAMRDVSELLAMPAATTTRIVDQLVASGWCYRHVSPEDRRSIVLFCTDVGTQVARRTARAVRDVEESLGASLDVAGLQADALSGALEDFTRH